MTAPSAAMRAAEEIARHLFGEADAVISQKLDGIAAIIARHCPATPDAALRGALEMAHNSIGDLRSGFSRSVDPARWVEQLQSYITAALAASPAGEAWRPIESAPKDGHRYLCAGINRGTPWVAIGYYAPAHGAQWCADYDDKALQGITHWQPLPAPPAEAGR